MNNIPSWLPIMLEDNYPCLFRLGRLLTMMRTKNSISIRDAAKQANISHQLLGFIESGRQPPTQEFEEKMQNANFYTDLGLLLHQICGKHDLRTIIEVERLIYVLPEELKKAIKINVFLCLRDLINSNSNRGYRISESNQKDGLIIFSPAFSWFMGGNFNKIISGNEFIAFYPANPDHITTSQVVDFALYLFNEIGYDILNSKIKCTVNNKEYKFSWSDYEA